MPVIIPHFPKGSVPHWWTTEQKRLADRIGKEMAIYNAVNVSYPMKMLALDRADALAFTLSKVLS